MKGATFKAGLFLSLAGGDAFRKGLFGIGKAAGQTDKKVTGLAQSLTRFGERSITAGRSVMAAGASILAPLTLATNEAMKIQDSLTKSTSTGAVSLEGANAARKESIRWMMLHNQTSEEFLEGYYRMISAGMDEKAALEGTKAAGALATATFGDLSGSAELLSTVYMNLGDRTADFGKETGRLRDILTVTQQAYQIKNLAQLSESFSQGTAAVSKYNVGIDQASIALGALNSAGKEGGEAGNSFSAFLQNVDKASGKLGFTVAHTKSGALDLYGTLQNLQKSRFGDFVKMTPKEREVFNTAFGGEQGSDAAALLLKKMPEITKGMTLMNSVTGTALRAQAAIEGTASERITALGNNAKAFGAVYGESILDPVAKGSNLLTRSIQRLTEWGMAHPQAAGKIAKATGAVGLFTTGIGGGMVGIGAFSKMLGFGIQGLQDLVPNLKSAGKALRNFRKMVGLGSLGFGWVTALAIGGLLIYKNWDKVSAFFQGFWNGIRPGLEPMMPYLKQLYNLGKWVFGKVGAFLGWIIDPAKKSKSELDKVKGAGENIGEAFRIAVGPLKEVVQWLQKVWTEFKGLLEKIAGSNMPFGISEQAQDLLYGIRKMEAAARGEKMRQDFGHMGFPLSAAARFGQAQPFNYNPNVPANYPSMVPGPGIDFARQVYDQFWTPQKAQTPKKQTAWDWFVDNNSYTKMWEGWKQYEEFMSGMPQRLEDRWKRGWENRQMYFLGSTSQMGAAPEAPVTVTIKDERVITLNGASDPKSIRDVLDMSNRTLEGKIKEMLNQRNRRAFTPSPTGF